MKSVNSLNIHQNADQRLLVSRALCLQALKQPLWLLAAQRVSAPSSHAPAAADSQNELSNLLGRCIESFLHKLNDCHISQSPSQSQRQSQTHHAQKHGPG